MLKATHCTIPLGIKGGFEQEKAVTVCFRCGVCCTKYQVRLSLSEAQRLAGDLGLSWEEWLERYIDKRWPGTQSFLLRQQNRACVFLERTEGARITRCLIHHVRPVSCRKWKASLYRKECREGLLRYWGLTVSPAGKLEGPAERLKDFQSFIASL